MKLSCEIVRDLLPLYQDGVCSHESKTAIAEHLSDCPSCTDALEDIRLELKAAPAAPQDDISAQKAIGALGRRWRRSKMLTALFWAAVAMSLTVLSFWAYHTLCEVDNTPAAASQVEVAYLYRTPEGDLNMRIRFKDGKRSQGTAVREVFLDDEQGIRACYLTLLRPRVILDTTPDALAGEFGMGGFTNADTNMRLYYGTPEDHFLIWEPGMEVPVMTEKEAEAFFGNTMEKQD